MDPEAMRAVRTLAFVLFGLAALHYLVPPYLTFAVRITWGAVFVLLMGLVVVS